MKITKRIFAVVLTITMLVTLSVPSFAVSKDDWSNVWGSNNAEAGIIMFVGSDETERNFSWYSEKNSTPTITISTNKDLTSPQVFEGTCIEAIESGYANKVTVTGLKENTKYYYQCQSEGFKSKVYSFKTDGKTEFSAMYVTDVHITAIDDGNPDSLRDTSYRLHETVTDALKKNKNISLLLSAGDQATEGLESEYKAFTASDLLKSMSIATAMGNHDRKGAAYKVFKNVPNEDTEASIRSYNGTDYRYIYGHT